MKLSKLASFFAALLFCAYSTNAQNINMQNGNFTQCSGALFDSGGSGGEYGNNENFTLTICPTGAGNAVGVSVSSFDIPAGDELCIYDGNSAAATELVCIDNTGTILPGTVIVASVNNPTGCLTLVFTSDATNTGNFEFNVFCQASCQQVLANLDNTVPARDPADPDFINVCFGESITLTASGTYPENNTDYAQSDATSTFDWDFGDGFIDQGTTVSHTYANAGGYQVLLRVTDVNGCQNSNSIPIKVRVGSEPVFTTTATDTIICEGTDVTLTGSIEGIQAGDSIIGETLFFAPPLNSGDSIFLPDFVATPGVYNTSIFVSGFLPGQTLTDADLLSIWANLEHSYAGDLDIIIECPDGTTVSLLVHDPLGGVNNLELGGATTSPAPPGPGAIYEWNTTGTQTWMDWTGGIGSGDLPAGTYLPDNPMSGLLGCPLNGNWILTFIDNLNQDDGTLYGWGLDFDPSLYPNPDSFTMVYDARFWLPDTTITGGNGTDQIIVTPESEGSHSYTFTVENTFGCVYDTTIEIDVEVLELEAFGDTSLCTSEPIQIYATTDADTSSPVQAVDCDDYVYSTANFAPVGGSGTSVALSDDQVSSALPIGFRFEFFCNAYTQFFISSNGFVTFTGGGNAGVGAQAMPSVIPPNNIIALAWADLNPAIGGDINYFTIGAAPNRQLIVNFDGVPHFGGAAPLTTQLILFETTNAIEIHTTVQPDALGFHTQGVENELGNLARTTPGRNFAPWTTANNAVRFVPRPIGPPVQPVTITWAPGATLSATDILNPIATPTTTTTYMITIDEGLCVKEDSVTISVGAGFTADTTLTHLTCNGGSDGEILITPQGGTPPFTYALDTASPQSQNQFTGLTAGVYQVAVRDSLGCGTSFPVRLDEPTAVEIMVVDLDTPSCAGISDGAITVSAMGGTAPYTYSINGGAFSSDSVFASISDGLYTITVRDAANCDTSVQATLPAVTSLIISVNTTDVLCFGGTDGAIDVIASGGNPPYSYSIDGTNFQTNPNFPSLPAAIYTVSLQDDSSCTVTSTDTIFQPDQLTAEPIADSTTCFGVADGSITINNTLGGTQPYEYALDGGTFQNSNVFSGLAAATYTITVRDQNLCDTVYTIEVFEPAAMISQVANIDSITCFGADDGQITVSVAGGTLPYSYSINSGAGQASPTFSSLSPNTYIITTSDVNACNASDTVVLAEPAEIILSADTFGLSCANQSDGRAVIHVLSGGVNPVSYSLSGSPAQTDSVFDNLPAGNYQAVVTDADGCSANIDLVIDEPDPILVTLNASDISCNGSADGEINISATNGQVPYQYSLDGVSFQDSAFFASLGQGTYTVTVRDDNGCTGSEVIAVNEPAQLVVPANGEDVTCHGFVDGTVTFDPTGGVSPYSYSISEDGVNFDSFGPDADSLTVENLSPGVYDYVALDANSCVIQGFFEIGQPDPIVITPVPEGTSCFGPEFNDGRVQVFADLDPSHFPPMFSLDGGPLQSEFFFDSLSAGQHSVTVVDAEGCEAIQYFDISQPPPVIVFIEPDSPTIAIGNSIQLNSAVLNSTSSNYFWTPAEGLSCTDCPNPVASPFENTVYTLVVENVESVFNSCFGQQSIEVFVVEAPSTFIPNAFTPNGDNINDRFEVSGEEILTVDLKIFNRWGEKVFETTNMLNGWDGTYKGKKVRPGVYVYSMEVTHLNNESKAYKGSVTVVY